ncbi:hypothetical protein BCR21_02735 [Enterococcus ureasiticus]|uniref:Uncharacterized protein n=1 Tax=Enterococcus ureasiticus TaxID=903984 RepID=A0A1E5GMK8_9ENTE|nr:hypothetical protein BCR21_02735 [Enterococcus ureasiticus]
MVTSLPLHALYCLSSALTKSVAVLQFLELQLLEIDEIETKCSDSQQKVPNVKKHQRRDFPAVPL